MVLRYKREVAYVPDCLKTRSICLRRRPALCMGNCAESIPYMSASGIRIFDVTDKNKTKWSGTMLRKKQKSYIIKIMW